MLPLARRLAHSAVAESLSKALAGCGGLLTAAGSGRSAARTRWRGAHASISNAAWVKAEVRALKAEARASKAEAEARASKAVADARASKAEAEARAAKAVADARASKAEAEARASKAVAEARAAKAEADAEARAVKAEAGAEARAVKAEAGAEARAVKAEAVTGDLTSKLELTHRDLAESRSEGLRLTNTRNLRGAIEHASELVARDLAAAQVPTKPGVQNVLIAAAATEGQRLHGAVRALAARHTQRARDVRSCLAGLYHTLSKGMHHGSGDDVLVRETDFAAPAERLAVCALLEAYDLPYTYVLASGERLAASPYALQPVERAGLRPATPDDT